MASEGDPRVLFVMNLVLSFLFSVVTVTALSFVGVSEFSWQNVGLATLFLMVVTYIAVLR